jgi:hypothetical protein
MKLLTRLAALGCSLICGCAPQSDPSPAEALRLSFDAARGMSEQDVGNAVNNAARSQNAIVFVYVAWAPMRPQTTRFAEFAIQWQGANPSRAIGFHFIDFTNVCDDYRPLTSLPGWPTRDDRPHIGRIGGWGELVWIAGGRVVHIQTALDFRSATELVTLTNDVFGAENGG